MSEKLTGKRALITGAASGIGRAAAELFVREGARVALADHNRQAGEEATVALGPNRARFFGVDVSEPESVGAMVAEAVRWLGGLDILVNCAGISSVGQPVPLAEVSLESWDRVLDTNLRGTFLVCRSCLPHLVAAGGGAIVNIASTYAVVGGPHFGAYCASKGGVLQLTRNIALDYAPKVRANAVAPGFVDTPMLRADIAKDPDPQASLADILARIPQAELMTPEQVARVIVFLASDDSAIMTGSLLVADGGYTAR